MTSKQLKLLQFIRNRFVHFNEGPTFREMKNHMGVSSNQTIKDWLNILERDKFIRQIKGKNRGIFVTEKGMSSNLELKERQPKMKPRNVCVYCGQKADTKDHIPTKNLFRNTSGISFITVPSCRKCNSGFQKDEEFFRQFLVSILYKQSPVASFLLHNPVARSIKRKPALGMQMFNQMSVVDYYSKGGIYLGKKTALHVPKKDHQRVFNVLDKYIKGLFYYHFNKILLDDWVIKHHWLMRKFEERVVDTLKDMRWERIKEDTFVYGFNSVPKTHQSIWCLIFFGQPLFYTFVIDKKNAEKFEKSYLRKK